MLESKNLHQPVYEVVDVKTTWTPPKSLKTMNLEHELLDQFNSAKAFLNQIESDDEIPPNQIAQVMNTLASITKQIIAMQGELHNQETIKKMEAAMVHALKSAPTEVQDAFLEAYEGALA